MICSRLIVTILIFLLFILYQFYRVNTLIETSLESDRQVRSLATASRQCKCPSSLFTYNMQQVHCQGVSANTRNLVAAQILTTLDSMLHNDTQSHVIREDIPNIVPPTPASLCRNSTILRPLGFCIEDLKDAVLIATYIGVGLIIVPALFLFFWIFARWTRAVHQKNEAILRYQAKVKVVSWTGSDLRRQRKWFIPQLIWANMAEIDEESGRDMNVREIQGRIKETEMFNPDIAPKFPWDQSKKQDRAVTQRYGKGIMQDIQFETTPNSSSYYIIKPGQFERINNNGGHCPRAESGKANYDNIRAVSTGAEASTNGEIIFQRRRSGAG